MTPAVSIGITTHAERAGWCERAALSVLRQDFAGTIELIICDDASTDETPAVCDQLAAQWDLPDRYVTVLRCDTSVGMGRAKNIALSACGGTYQGLLDSDDWYEPRFVRRCVEVLEADPELVAVYTDNRYVNVTGDTLIGHEQADDWSLEALRRCRIRGDCYLARKTALDRTQLHDERLVLEEDYNLYYQLAALGPLRRIPEPLQVITEHGERTTRDRQQATYWHAAVLAKFGQPIEWAYRRKFGKAWATAGTDANIEAGYAFGVQCREEDRRRVADH